MNETNLDWDDLRLFLAVARGGGLAVAAQATGKSPPTLGRRMLALETAVGAELFQRLPRGYDLTEAGAAFLTKITALETQIDPLTQSARRDGRPLIRISAGTWMTRVLCDAADQILGPRRDTRLRFIAADHVLDIARREAVIGIRNHRPEQLGLACRRVGQVRFAGYATGARPVLWARVMGKTPSAQWVAAHKEPGDCLEVTTPRNALDLALAGAACVVLPTFVGDRTPGLLQVTPLIDELQHDQWLVTHAQERFIPEVRGTIDRVYTVLRDLHRMRDV